MKVDIAKLAEGREIEFLEEWRAKERDLDVFGWSYAGPVRVRVLCRRDAGMVRVRADLKAAARLTCGRCFKEFEKAVDNTFHLAYPVDLSEKVIVLDDDIRQELILSYPHQVLCRPDCRGLCPRCGADLNERVCACASKPGRG